MTMAAMISIIVPIYNQERYLEKCLQSILYQSFQDFELVLVNDGSTDASLKIMKKYNDHYPSKIKIINKENGGLSSARNAGLEKATGKYVTFIDSDDYIDKDYLKTLIEVAEKNGSDVVCSGQYKVKEDGEIIKKINFHPQDGKCLMRRLNISGKIYRREYLSKWDIVFPVGKTYEDNSFNLQALFLTKKSYFLEYAGYYQVVHEGSITSKPIRAESLPLAEWESCIQKVLSNADSVIDVELFEFTVLSFFTYFLFVRLRKREYLKNGEKKAVNSEIANIALIFQNIVNQHFPNAFKNKYASATIKYRELSIIQRIGVKVFAIVCRTKKIKPFVKVVYTIAN